ncbi:MAG: hypothetical protein ACK4JA_12610 [Parazoarcus communis]
MNAACKLVVDKLEALVGKRLRSEDQPNGEADSTSEKVAGVIDHWFAGRFDMLAQCSRA